MSVCVASMVLAPISLEACKHRRIRPLRAQRPLGDPESESVAFLLMEIRWDLGIFME